MPPRDVISRFLRGLGRGSAEGRGAQRDEPAAQWDALRAELNAMATLIAAQAQQARDEAVKHRVALQWRIIDQLIGMAPAPTMLACEICGFQDEPRAFRQLDSKCMFGGGRLVRHQCPACDTIFGPQKMLNLTADQLSEEYELHYRVFPEGDSTQAEIRAFEALQPVKGGRYLNYGAGAWSRSVGELRSRGWDVMAYEPHQSAAAGENVISDETQLDAMRFDGIFSNNVLEHFRFPVQALRKMTSLLSTNGRMSHATPCFAYLYEYTRFHLHFFPGRSLDALARSAGLQVDQFTVDGEFMNAVLRPLAHRTIERSA
jgi:hypothetical protein